MQPDLLSLLGPLGLCERFQEEDCIQPQHVLQAFISGSQTGGVFVVAVWFFIVVILVFCLLVGFSSFVFLANGNKSLYSQVLFLVCFICFVNSQIFIPQVNPR